VTPDKYQRFALKLAALYHNEKGSLGLLSEALGGSPSLLHMALNGGGLNARHCIALEKLLGREHFPREFFAPSIFIASTAE
jgi:hypothetical protein